VSFPIFPFFFLNIINIVVEFLSWMATG
jgi:hypothetical protein